MEEYLDLISAYTFTTAAVPFTEAEGGVLIECYKAFELYKAARQREVCAARGHAALLMICLVYSLARAVAQGLPPFGFALPEQLLVGVNAMTARLQCAVDELR
jgi:hypothetical protein